MIKILYLYSGTRKDKFKGRISIDYPDTQFYGLNHLSKFGIEAEYREFGDFAKNKFLNKLFGFRIRHFLLYFITNRYDIVFGSSLLFMMIFKKVFKPKTKFILLNIGFTRTVSANKNKKFKLKIIAWLLKEFNAIVCLSTLQKEYIESKFPNLKVKIFFVPLGVDIKYYKPNYKNRKNYILSVGRDNGRDYKTVIETARLMPHEEFHLVCSKRNLAGIKDTPENVKVFYDLPINELNRKYQEAKLMLLITHDDNFFDGSDCSGQTVLLDAMASGLPIIASRKKYLKDYVIDNKEILPVDFYNAAKIREKIEVLNSDGNLRLRIAKNARERTEKEFSTEQTAGKLTSIFGIIKNED